MESVALVLGIDTSNYTTSLAAVRATDGQLAAEARMLLPVAAGERGLRQSEALFFHVKRLPLVMADLMAQLERQGQKPAWSAVGVSVRPRPLASSYMPVFGAGESFAASFARALALPVVRASHQEGHVAAAMHFLNLPRTEPVLAVHLSGGTSDVLEIHPTRFGFRVESIGEGADLHAGQFVDRVGVAMGLPFPAGPHLEKLAIQGSDDRGRDEGFRLSATVRGSSMSFSGPCTAALRALDDGVPQAKVALAVQACVANSVVKAIQHAALERPFLAHCVIAGGVASNQWISARIRHRMRILQPDLQIWFAPPRFASDNAVGAASIALRMLRS